MTGRRLLWALILGLAGLTGYLEYRHRHPAVKYAGACDSDEASALRVLFVGNSLTFFNEMPGLFCELSLKAGAARVRVVVAPGWSLRDHLDAGDAERAIGAERWDFVVLQEQGVRPTLNAREFEVSLRQFAAIAAARGARAALYETWALSDSGQDARALHAEFVAMSRETGFLLVPVGPAWYEANRRYPRLQFLAADGHHPSFLGSALAAQVFYASLLNRSPEGVSQMTGVDSETSRGLQRVAWDAARWARTPAAAGEPFAR